MKLLLLSTALAAAAGLASCSGPDPGSITFSERAGAPRLPGSTPGGPAATDGGAAVDPNDPVFQGTTFAYVAPALQANNANVNHAGTVVGKDCVVAGCHLDGNRPWLFAGTVFTASDGVTPVTRAEIRVMDGTTEVGKTYTDDSGNFWFPKGDKTIPEGSRVGVRREGGSIPKIMGKAIGAGNGGCQNAGNDCHGTTLTGKIYVP